MDCSTLTILIQEKVIYVVLAILILIGYSQFTLRQYYAVADYASAFNVSPTVMPFKVRYDVFPSFHGSDVRKGFISHLRKELRNNAIDIFMDDDMERGKQIAPLIIESVRGSKLAIVVLSGNYASSTWCLDELSEIMTSREYLHLKVMVVFYEVDPTDVKKQSGVFGRVFRKTCAGKRKADIERWRHALVRVATIAGYHSIRWKNEADMIEHIVNEVSFKLNYTIHTLYPTR